MKIKKNTKTLSSLALFIAFLFNVVMPVSAHAQSTFVYFTELEEGIDPYPVRYIFSED